MSGKVPPQSTKLEKIKNLHSTDTIATENSGTRGRPIWVHSSQVGKADSKWVCHVVPAYPNVSPGPMNGSILLRWACTYRIANFSLGGSNLRKGQFRVRLYAYDGAAPTNWHWSRYRDDSSAVDGASIEWTAPSSGEHYLAIDGAFGSIGTYTVKVTLVDKGPVD